MSEHHLAPEASAPRAEPSSASGDDEVPPVESPPIGILLLEDNDGDAALIRARLKHDGLDARIERVFRIDDFSAACQRGGFDVILSDFNLPAWTGWHALELAQKLAPAVPFIFVSGVMGEDLAVDSLRHGATDYVIKDRLTRLCPAIRRAMAERETRAGLHRAELALRQQEANYRLIAENTRDTICLHASDGSIQFVSPAVKTLLGFEPAEWIGRRPRDFAHAEDADRLVHEVGAIIASGGRRQAIQARMRHKDGRHVWVEITLEPIRDAAQQVVQVMSVTRDFTARREAEEAMRRGERLFEGIAEANRLLLTAGRVSDTLPHVLRALGEAAEADRVALFEFRPHSHTGQLASALRCEWARDPSFSIFSDPRMAELPLSDLGRGSTVERVGSGESVAARAEDTPTPERRLMEEHGVRSAITFPISVAGRVWGHVGFDQCTFSREWLPSERSALGTVAANIGQAIEREQAQASLAESERRYEALLAGLSEGVFHIDLEARWRFLNPTWQELTGHCIADCLGRRFSEFVAPEDAASALEGFGRLVSGRNERIESEIRFRHRNGSEVWLRVMAQPQIDDTGRIVGVSGTLVDVTQRRQAEEALRASERKFSAVFASSSDALFLVDTATNLIVECNPRAVEMFDCDETRELIGTNGAALQRRPLSEAEQAEARLRLSRGEVWSRELEYVTRRGRVFWGQLAIVRITPEALGITLVRVTDITELKRSEERLRGSLAEKEVLLKEVYHRVKNNLQIISALLRMQTRRVKDRHAVAALENSISRVMAMAMVHEKLYQAQNLVSIDFLSFAQSLVGFLNQLTVGAKAPVIVEVEGEPLALSIDQAIPLGLVLNELVTNSIKYAFPERRSGRVMIRIAREHEHQARVVVADDGVGLPAHVNVENSNGLGFRIVQMLVEQLQGSLLVESRGGLQVTVRTPLPPHGARE